MAIYENFFSHFFQLFREMSDTQLENDSFNFFILIGRSD